MKKLLSSGLPAFSRESHALLPAAQPGRLGRFVRHRVTGSVVRGLLFFILLLTPFEGLAQPRVVALPFRYVHSFILVDAKIDGTPVRLLVDTGANQTILNAKSFGKVELHVSKPINRGAGIVGNALRLRVDLEIAHEFLFSQHVSVIDLEELSRHFGVQFDGLLGQDILNQFHSVRIDYKKHLIELEP